MDASSITATPIREIPMPIQVDLATPRRGMPSKPSPSISAAVMVCPSRPNAVRLVTLMRPKAKLLKNVVSTPITPPR